MIIGIDLGTTNSAIAFLDNDEARIIPNDRGNRITPSIVARTNSGEVLVGEAAKNQAAVNPGGTAISVKRLMGSGNKISLGDTSYLPEEISAQILKKLKHDAQAWLGEDILEAVITVPAYFSEPQRRKTKEAGRKAGLRVSRIINEPTAAALAYASGSEGKKTVMVYDLGGGTFDVTILCSSGEEFTVLSTSGDNKLGGIDFDKLLFDRIADHFLQTRGVDFTADPMMRQQLMEQAERVKIELSSREKARVSFPFIGGGNKPVHLDYEVSREELHELITPLILKTVELSRSAIKEAKVSPDTLILSGGSSRIPLLRSLLADLTGLEPESRVNPEEVVALGAAVHAGMLEQGKRSRFTDVTPLPLGVEIEGGNVITVLEKNSPLPAMGRQLFTTISDRQRSVEVHVLQGLGKRAEENSSLGRFLLGGIREGSQGEPLIEVRFRVDEDGILHASARDMDTGAIQKVVMSREGESESNNDKLSQKVEALTSRVKKKLATVGGFIDNSFMNEIREVLFSSEGAVKKGSHKELSSCRFALETILGELEALEEERDLHYG
jgi:molecular chaperone DnaK